MKKILLTMAMSLFAFLAIAQSNTKYVYATHSGPKKITPFVPEHDIRFSIGFAPTSLGTNNFGEGYSFTNYTFVDVIPEKIVKTPAFSVAYSYRTERWLEIGVTLSCNSIYGVGYSTMSDNVYRWKGRTTDISIFPTVRFIWYRSSSIRLYSSVGTGMLFSIRQEDRNNLNYSNMDTDFAGQMTFIGISAGKKLFGFAEMGSVGSCGSAIFGVGYRFLDKRSK